ncbi:TetR/AcrR family transcriptional regulator [Mesorhizobium sp. SB112]|uniref:TetR/AcrR family transcriptional regulator n=1 Tax=Mesorhizobium sp. SB112 TaxID=3151853 RepID=UPI003264FA51
MFDREAALRSALALFWRVGYEPATISELCKAMGINPPSLYAAFGNKAQLFMEAVDYYETTYWDAAWLRLEQAKDIRQGIVDFFGDAARILSLPDAPCGCLVTLGATNVSPESGEVHDALKALRLEGRVAFQARLEQAVKDGQLPPDTAVGALAMTLNTAIEGMSLQASDGAKQADLEAIGPLLVRMLPTF